MKRNIEKRENELDKSIEGISEPKKIFLVGDKLIHLELIKENMLGLWEGFCNRNDIDRKVVNKHEENIYTYSPDEAYAELANLMVDDYPDFIIWKGLSNIACNNLYEDEAKNIFRKTMGMVKNSNKTTVIPHVTLDSDHAFMVQEGASSEFFGGNTKIFERIWPVLKNNPEKSNKDRVLYIGSDKSNNDYDFMNRFVEVKKIEGLCYGRCSSLLNINNVLAECDFRDSYNKIMLTREVIDNFDRDSILAILDRPLRNGIGEVILFYNGGMIDCDQQARVDNLKNGLESTYETKKVSLFLFESDWMTHVKNKYKKST